MKSNTTIFVIAVLLVVNLQSPGMDAQTGDENATEGKWHRTLKEALTAHIPNSERCLEIVKYLRKDPERGKCSSLVTSRALYKNVLLVSIYGNDAPSFEFSLPNGELVNYSSPESYTKDSRQAISNDKAAECINAWLALLKIPLQVKPGDIAISGPEYAAERSHALRATIRYNIQGYEFRNGWILVEIDRYSGAITSFVRKPFIEPGTIEINVSKEQAIRAAVDFLRAKMFPDPTKVALEPVAEGINTEIIYLEQAEGDALGLSKPDGSTVARLVYRIPIKNSANKPLEVIVDCATGQVIRPVM